MNSKIILGTVQFGIDYGINNQNGKPSEKEVFDILNTAAENKIEFLDTADAYGNASEIIGLYHKKHNYCFKILGKFKSLKEKSLYDHVMYSLEKLQISFFEVYSFHSFEDYENISFLRDELFLLKQKKLIHKIGISTYKNSELEKTLTDKLIDVIQFPYNILDNENIRGKSMDNLKKSGKELHARSVFLQGLLFMSDEKIPAKLIPLKKYLQAIRNYCKNNDINLHSLALSYPLFNSNIDKILIGVDNKEQLIYNLNSIAEIIAAFIFIDKNIIVKETDLLNPINWI